MNDARSAALIMSMLVAACTSPEDRTAATRATRAREPLLVPAADRGNVCADLTEVRACWGGGNVDTCVPACVMARPVPNVPAPSALGWRCTGARESRQCVDRQRGVGSFTCGEGHCVQRYPRLPDDGEWTCDDVGGVAVCTGGDAPAGVAKNVAESGFFCGDRLPVSPSSETPRVCIDLAPDFPDGVAHGWRCRYASEESLIRICERDAAAHAVGDRCDSSHPCLDGLMCVAERCIPERPSPSCTLDRDCEHGVCRFGSCRKEPG